MRRGGGTRHALPAVLPPALPPHSNKPRAHYSNELTPFRSNKAMNLPSGSRTIPHSSGCEAGRGPTAREVRWRSRGSGGAPNRHLGTIWRAMLFTAAMTEVPDNSSSQALAAGTEEPPSPLPPATRARMCVHTCTQQPAPRKPVRTAQTSMVAITPCSWPRALACTASRRMQHQSAMFQQVALAPCSWPRARESCSSKQPASPITQYET